MPNHDPEYFHFRVSHLQTTERDRNGLTTGTPICHHLLWNPRRKISPTSLLTSFTIEDSLTMSLVSGAPI